MQPVRENLCDVVGVGLNATDTVIAVPDHPARGAKVEATSVKVLPGGQVATAMIACASWGLRARYVGKLGDDSAAQVHRDAFARAAVETHLIAAENCSSQQSFILVDREGERTAIGWRENRLALTPAELNREWIVNSHALLVDGYDTDAAATAAGWARESGVPVIADLDDTYPALDALLPNVDYLIASRDFPNRQSSEVDLRKSLPELQRRYHSKIAAATLGSDGVLAWDGKQLHYAPAYRVSVVDTTGAGDIFHAGFIYGLLQDWPLRHILDFSCAAAALNCQAIGARGGICPVPDIESLMKRDERYPAAWDGADLASWTRQS